MSNSFITVWYLETRTRGANATVLVFKSCHKTFKQAGTGPYPRLKNSKKRLPSVKYSLWQNSTIKNFSIKKFSKKLHTQKNGPSGAPGPASASPWRAKVSQCRKTERGPFEVFQHPFCRKTSKKQGGPFGEKNSEKKVSQCRKKIERRDSLVSPGMVCYAEKQVKPFWSSSLGQMVQFDTIIFCRTFGTFHENSAQRFTNMLHV